MSARPFVGLVLVFVDDALPLGTAPSPALAPTAARRTARGDGLWIATYVLRLYLTALARSGYTYGALATPIAFLLFAFFLGFAIVVGAEFNATIESIWPASPSRGSGPDTGSTSSAPNWPKASPTASRPLPAKFGTGPIGTRRNRE